MALDIDPMIHAIKQLQTVQLSVEKAISDISELLSIPSVQSNPLIIKEISEMLNEKKEDIAKAVEENTVPVNNNPTTPVNDPRGTQVNPITGNRPQDREGFKRVFESVPETPTAKEVAPVEITTEDSDGDSE